MKPGLNQGGGGRLLLQSSDYHNQSNRTWVPRWKKSPGKLKKRNEAWFESRWWVVSGGGRLLQSSDYTSPEQPDLVGDGGKRVRLS